MMNKKIKKLIQHLNSLGIHKESKNIEHIIQKIAQDNDVKGAINYAAGGDITKLSEEQKRNIYNFLLEIGYAYPDDIMSGVKLISLIYQKKYKDVAKNIFFSQLIKNNLVTKQELKSMETISAEKLIENKKQTISSTIVKKSFFLNKKYRISKRAKTEVVNREDGGSSPVRIAPTQSLPAGMKPGIYYYWDEINPPIEISEEQAKNLVENSDGTIAYWKDGIPAVGVKITKDVSGAGDLSWLEKKLREFIFQILPRTQDTRRSSADLIYIEKYIREWVEAFRVAITALSNMTLEDFAMGIGHILTTKERFFARINVFLGLPGNEVARNWLSEEELNATGSAIILSSIHDLLLGAGFVWPATFALDIGLYAAEDKKEEAASAIVFAAAITAASKGIGAAVKAIPKGTPKDYEILPPKPKGPEKQLNKPISNRDIILEAEFEEIGSTNTGYSNLPTKIKPYGTTKIKLSPEAGQMALRLAGDIKRTGLPNAEAIAAEVSEIVSRGEVDTRSILDQGRMSRVESTSAVISDSNKQIARETGRSIVSMGNDLISNSEKILDEIKSMEKPADAGVAVNNNTLPVVDRAIAEQIPRAATTKHRLFTPFTLGAAEDGALIGKPGRAYRNTGEPQILDIIETGVVRTKEGKLRGGRRGETHWSSGEGYFSNPPTYDGAYILEANLPNNITGLITIDDLFHVWTGKDGKWVDILPKIKEEYLKKNPKTGQSTTTTVPAVENQPSPQVIYSNPEKFNGPKFSLFEEANTANTAALEQAIPILEELDRNYKTIQPKKFQLKKDSRYMRVKPQAIGELAETGLIAENSNYRGALVSERNAGEFFPESLDFWVIETKNIPGIMDGNIVIDDISHIWIWNPYENSWKDILSQIKLDFIKRKIPLTRENVVQSSLRKSKIPFKKIDGELVKDLSNEDIIKRYTLEFKKNIQEVVDATIEYVNKSVPTIYQRQLQISTPDIEAIKQSIKAILFEFNSRSGVSLSGSIDYFMAGYVERNLLSRSDDFLPGQQKMMQLEQELLERSVKTDFLAKSDDIILIKDEARAKIDEATRTTILNFVAVKVENFATKILLDDSFRYRQYQISVDFIESFKNEITEELLKDRTTLEFQRNNRNFNLSKYIDDVFALYVNPLIQKNFNELMEANKLGIVKNLVAIYIKDMTIKMEPKPELSGNTRAGMGWVAQVHVGDGSFASKQIEFNPKFMSKNNIRDDFFESLDHELSHQEDFLSSLIPRKIIYQSIEELGVSPRPTVDYLPKELIEIRDNILAKLNEVTIKKLQNSTFLSDIVRNNRVVDTSLGSNYNLYTPSGTPFSFVSDAIGLVDEYQKVPTEMRVRFTALKDISGITKIRGEPDLFLLHFWAAQKRYGFLPTKGEFLKLRASNPSIDAYSYAIKLYSDSYEFLPYKKIYNLDPQMVEIYCFADSPVYTAKRSDYGEILMGIIHEMPRLNEAAKAEFIKSLNKVLESS